MTAVDTNVLLYVHDPRDPDKQSTAASLVESLVDGVLLWQVACEYLAASRKLEPLGYRRERAWLDIHELRGVWITVLPSWNALERTEQLLARYSLSFWDALLLGVCLEAGVTRLYSEDFDAYSRVDKLEVINPFRSR
jgi:predicted nucleic acid-binding protein